MRSANVRKAETTVIGSETTALDLDIEDFLRGLRGRSSTSAFRMAPPERRKPLRAAALIANDSFGTTVYFDSPPCSRINLEVFGRLANSHFMIKTFARLALDSPEIIS
jgi:hypothetical protein